MMHDPYEIAWIASTSRYRYHVTGSFLVNMETAKDIDVVVLYHDTIHSDLESNGYENTTEEYEEQRCLRSTWRKRNYNIIVAPDEIAYSLWLAYSNILQDPDFQFEDKELRVKVASLIHAAYPD